MTPTLGPSGIEQNGSVYSSHVMLMEGGGVLLTAAPSKAAATAWATAVAGLGVGVGPVPTPKAGRPTYSYSTSSAALSKDTWPAAL